MRVSVSFHVRRLVNVIVCDFIRMDYAVQVKSLNSVTSQFNVLFFFFFLLSRGVFMTKKEANQ